MTRTSASLERLKPRSIKMAYAAMEREESILRDMIATWRRTRATLPFPRLPAKPLTRLWRDIARDGFVRDEASLERLKNKLIDSMLSVALATTVYDHTPVCGRTLLVEAGLGPDEIEPFADALAGPPPWRISDAHHDVFRDIAGRLIVETDPMHAHVLMDIALSLAHQRGSLAEIFVQGGEATLAQISSE